MITTYVISVPGFLKVGRALNVQRRIDFLQTGNPHELVLLGTMPGDHEWRAHHTLVQSGVKRVRGEWFQDGPRAREVLWTLGLLEEPALLREVG